MIFAQFCAKSVQNQGSVLRVDSVAITGITGVLSVQKPFTQKMHTTYQSVQK